LIAGQHFHQILDSTLDSPYVVCTYSRYNEWNCFSSETMIASIAASWSGPLANVRKDEPNGPIQSAKLRTVARSSFVNGSHHWLLRFTVDFELGWNYFIGYDTWIWSFGLSL